MTFNKKHFDLLEKEFGLTRSDLSRISKDEWFQVREECMWITSDEIIDFGDFTERAEIAEEISDTKYSMLTEAIGNN